jgi:hypothetical protein
MQRSQTFLDEGRERRRTATCEKRLYRDEERLAKQILDDLRRTLGVCVQLLRTYEILRDARP